MDHAVETFGGRKRFYVSVQAGQVLEDPQAAAYELEIDATNEEVNQLREMMEELSSMDEAEAAHFASTPYETNLDSALSGGSDEIIMRIYKHLHKCGTEQTKRHIESMHLY